MSSWVAHVGTIRKLLQFAGPVWHRTKQFGWGCVGIGCMETVLFYYYFPNRATFNDNEYKFLPFNVDFVEEKQKNKNNFNQTNPTLISSNDILPLEIQFMIFDILSIYRDKPLGMYCKYFNNDIVTETPWFKWIGLPFFSVFVFVFHCAISQFAIFF